MTVHLVDVYLTDKIARNVFYILLRLDEHVFPVEMNWNVDYSFSGKFLWKLLLWINRAIRFQNYFTFRYSKLVEYSRKGQMLLRINCLICVYIAKPVKWLYLSG